MNYKRLVQKAYYLDLGEEMMWEIVDHTSKFIESIRPMHPAEVDKFLMDMENKICYPELTEEKAKEYVHGMKHKDGTEGEHWSIDQVKAYMESHSEYSDLHLLDFYVAMNMMFSDYAKPTFSTDNYAALAKDFITDKDAPSNKVVRYMEAMR